ncbi:MAG: DUF1295 domain-containing protein [Myxococcota bacterium]
MFPFDEHFYYAAALAFVLGFGAVSFPLLFFVTAPYGRHLRKGWGPTMPAKLGWVVMEAPSPIGFAVVFLTSGRAFETVPLVLFGMWQLHYIYRTFIFPLRMRGSGKRKPVLTVVFAFLFNCANGAMNAYAITWLAPHLNTAWLTDPRFIVGVLVFVTGWAMNQHADAVLRNLRAPGETGYKIPFGGMYRFVSCPNYFGEIVEWCGFALAASTPAGWAFAFFTAANLVPRAVAHHRWYREKFDDYPTARRAVVPFLL